MEDVSIQKIIYWNNQLNKQKKYLYKLFLEVLKREERINRINHEIKNILEEV